MKDVTKPAVSDGLDCCPELSKDPCCDILDFRYRLPHRIQAKDPAGRVDVVTVEVILHIRITRCPGPLSLGDPIHTITLLPGEEVKLLYASQIGTAPPTLAIVSNRPDEVPESYQRYLVHGFREAWPFPGSPLRLKFTRRGSKR